jgi:3-hydroxyanthranilate 3,4-dioxygenase
MKIAPPFNFKNWIEEHRHLLKPPVGNQVVWKDRETIVMVVGGPNTRTDFHVNLGEEFFHQIEGDMVLRIMNDGRIEDISIRTGDIFLLPPGIPHSPQRPAGSIGMVVERKRRPEEKDGFVWFCKKCQNKLYDEYLHVSDIVSQLPPVFDRFFSNPAHTTCKKCGTTHTR